MLYIIRIQNSLILYMIMSINKNHILISYLLLIFFITGQGSLYFHQHKTHTIITHLHKQSTDYTLLEKCQLCDTMHFNNMLLNQETVIIPISITEKYISLNYKALSIIFIFSTGRSPPDS